MRALIVEDNFTNRKILNRFVEEYFEVDIAANGNEACEAFYQAHQEGQPYSVIFLDVMMPEKDGLTVVEEIRAFEAQQGIRGLDGVKIIITSALEGSKDILNAFKAGCEAYIVKPFSRSEINARLEELGIVFQRK
ncbi:MAG: response regulator [Calditrichaeota bacterium]|nr:MAG: response regulator [Calditrichota bacterium]